MVGTYQALAREGAGCTPAECIVERGKTVLVRYASERPKRYAVPVLIVTPFLAKPYILDLSPGLSFVDHLLSQGFEVFLIDFGTPDGCDRTRRFEDYVEDVGLAVETLVPLCGTPSVTLLGYCMGGILAVLYAGWNPEKVRNLVTLATPIDFANAGPLYSWVRGLDVDRLVDAVGNIPGRWMRDQTRFFASLLMPGRNLRIWLDALLHVWDREYPERQQLIARWLNDILPFPGEAYRQFIKEFVQANKLVRRELILQDKPIDLSVITCPVLALAHTEDILAPPQSAGALLGLVASRDTEFFKIAGGSIGHVDIIVGREGPKLTWPKVSSWLMARSHGPGE